MLAADQYNDWANQRNQELRINVIPYTHFESNIANIAGDLKLSLSVEQHLEYKNSHDIKSFNCLQKRLRGHRIWFYVKMHTAGILNDGLVSMNSFPPDSVWLSGQRLASEDIIESTKELPLLVYGKSNNEYDDGYYIRRIQDTVCLDSWVSVISEASFADSDITLFLSEKTFKPIACLHPFIILGNRGSLAELRKMGYKTFDGFIDESYDSLPTFERFDAVIESIKKIIAIEDKAAWYESMKDILIHNYNTLKDNERKTNPACIKLQQVYNTYFNIGS